MTDLMPHAATNGLVRAEPPVPARTVTALVQWAQEADAAYSLATKLVGTSFCPAAFRGKPEEAVAAMLAGAEVGLSPMSALRSFDVIQGTAAPRALTLRAVAQSQGAQFVTESATASKVVMRARRRGGEWETVTWTIERARDLGLTNKDNWKKQPQAMLVARATAELARLVAADALLGIGYAYEECEDEIPAPTTTVTRAESPKRNTVKRAAPPVEEPPLDEPQTAAGGVGAADLPAPMDDQDGTQGSLVDPSATGSEPEPGGISQAQSRMLHALFRQNGITDRELALAFCYDQIQREITSTKEMTKAECSKVIDALNALAEPVDGEVVDG